MKEYFFWIIRRHGGVFERIKILAEDDIEAMNKLPECVAWEFCNN